MSQPKWLEYLMNDASALEDFVRDLTRRRKSAESLQDGAKDWGEAREALGRKKVLDDLLRNATIQSQEDAAHAQHVKANGAQYRG